MLRILIIVIIVATVIATAVTRSFVAPPIGAAVLFAVILGGWAFNRGASPGNLRKAEEATHRQRAEHTGPRDPDPS